MSGSVSKDDHEAFSEQVTGAGNPLLVSARSAFNSNDFLKAVELYSQLLAIDPSNAEYLVGRAHAHTKAENYAEGKKDANTAIDVARSDEDKWRETIFKAFLRSGVASFHMGNYQEAKNCFLQGKEQPLADEKGIRQWMWWCDEKMEKLKAKRADTGGESAAAATAEQTTTTPDLGEKSLPKPAATPQATSKVKYDFYQTEVQLVIEIRIKGLRPDDVKVNFGACELRVEAENVNAVAYGVDRYQLHLARLSYPVAPDRCSFKVMSTKIEVRLAKKDGIRWASLEGAGTAPPANTTAVAAATQPKSVEGTANSEAAPPRPPAYPTSKPGARNWDRIEKEIEAELEQDKPEGEQALNELFQKIYKDADDDTRRAMNKSFQESGGTVLSTNWSDIQKEKTEVKPPDGMEYKKW